MQIPDLFWQDNFKMAIQFAQYLFGDGDLFL